MVITATLTDDEGRQIGELVAMRLDPVTEPEPDDECTYTWNVYLAGDGNQSSNEHGPVKHRHGDGPWALVAQVVTKAGL